MLNLIRIYVFVKAFVFSVQISVLPRSYVLDFSGKFGILSIRGADRLRLLHSLGSASFEDALPGDILPTCFLDASGKMLDYARCIITPDEDVKLVLESQNRAAGLAAHLNKFIFPSDKVSVVDESSLTKICLTLGKGISPEYIKSWFSISSASTLQTSFPLEGGIHKAVLLEDGAMLLPGNDLTADKPEYSSQMQESLSGYTIIKQSRSATPASFPNPPTTIAAAGTIEFLTGDEACEKWQEFRRVTGRFSVDFDARAFNATPCELGLMHTLHFRKGCYVGNEVISKVVSTKSVRRSFCGFVLEGDGELEVGDVLFDFEGENVATISTAPLAKGGQALGFLKSRLFESLASETSHLRLSCQKGTCMVLKLPFPRFNATQSSLAPPAEKLKSIGKLIIVPDTNAGIAESAEAERKRLKLEEMQSKVSALQAAQKLKNEKP